MISQNTQLLTTWLRDPQPSHFCTFKALVETKHGRHIKTLRTDHGGEYTSHAFKDLCLSAGICHEFSITDHSQQNGRIERKNRTLFKAARAMLLQSSLPDAYWEDGTATVCYIQNRIPSTRNPTTMSYTLWHGHPPHLGHLRIFGSITYPFVTQSLSKLSPRAQRIIFVGYGDRFGIKVARTVIFDEEFILSCKSSPPVHTTFSSPSSSVHSSHQSSLAASPTHTPMQNSYPSGHNFEPLLSIGRLSFITHPPPHACHSHAQRIGNSPTPRLAPIPSQLTPLPTPAATTSITPQTLSTPFSSLPLICRPHSPHLPTITSSPRQTPASSVRQSSFLLHGHSNMERALQTAHKSTTPSPLSPHHKPLPPLLPVSPSPSPSIFRNSHVISPSSPIPIDINKFESHNSTSTTSPPQHTLTLHLDQAASILHGRTHSLREIYEATSFSTVLNNETILGHPQEPLDDALPLSVHDALASSEIKEWHAAILDELQDLEATNTWELVPPLEHHNIVSCKWLLKKKYHSNGSVDRYKARVVARGFTQQEGVDYFDTYSPVLVWLQTKCHNISQSAHGMFKAATRSGAVNWCEVLMRQIFAESKRVVNLINKGLVVNTKLGQLLRVLFAEPEQRFLSRPCITVTVYFPITTFGEVAGTGGSKISDAETVPVKVELSAVLAPSITSVRTISASESTAVVTSSIFVQTSIPVVIDLAGPSGSGSGSTPIAKRSCWEVLQTAVARRQQSRTTTKTTGRCADFGVDSRNSYEYGFHA
ncbi:hypothetical protein L7F22_002598 [Adiantum nelumboides]|nr:hypothetical protein [Adiantum nelumboides]